MCIHDTFSHICRKFIELYEINGLTTRVQQNPISMLGFFNN